MQQHYPGFGGNAEKKEHLHSPHYCTAVTETNIFLGKNTIKHLLKFSMVLKTVRDYAFRTTLEKHMVPF